MSGASIIAFGIDLGTTNSCVASYMSNGEYNNVENLDGDQTTPSAVCFLNGSCIVGKRAIREMHRSPKTTYTYVKRFIGKKSDDKTIKSEIENVEYPVILDYVNPQNGEVDNRPRFPFSIPGYDEITQPLFPEHISAIVLKYLFKCCQAKTPGIVNDVVITVPANFNDYQRRATKDAGDFAGFNVLDVISEPTAAAICYAVKATEMKQRERVMVFDFGGGTFDVSVLEIDDYKFTVLATDGDTQCGGADIDNYLFERAVQNIKNKYNVDLMLPTEINKKLRSELRIKCEEAKKSLSGSAKVYPINLVYGTSSFSITISAETLNHLCEPLKKKLIRPMEAVMKTVYDRHNIDKSGISQVITVGGSSSLKFVNDLIKEVMDKEPYRPGWVNPAEAIARGAAIYGAYLKKHSMPGISKIEVTDVTPMAIGIGVVEHGKRVVRKQVEKNVPRPFHSREWSFLGNKGSKRIKIDLYEGDEYLQEDCHLIESCVIDNPELNDEGMPTVTVRIDISQECIELNAVSGSQVLKGVFQKNKPIHSKEEVERIKKEIDYLMSDHQIDDSDDDDEIISTPAKKFLSYISSINGRRELLKFAPDSKRKSLSNNFGKISKKYKEWAKKNMNAPQSEVDLQLEKLKLEIKGK